MLPHLKLFALLLPVFLRFLHLLLVIWVFIFGLNWTSSTSPVSNYFLFLLLLYLMFVASWRFFLTHNRASSASTNLLLSLRNRRFSASRDGTDVRSGFCLSTGGRLCFRLLSSGLFFFIIRWFLNRTVVLVIILLYLIIPKLKLLGGPSTGHRDASLRLIRALRFKLGCCFSHNWWNKYLLFHLITLFCRSHGREPLNVMVLDNGRRRLVLV